MNDKVDKAMNSSLQTGSDMSPKLAFASGSPSCFSKACAVAGIAGHMKLHSWVLPFPPPGVFESSFAVAQSATGTSSPHRRHIVAIRIISIIRLTLHFVSPDSSHRCSFTTPSSLYLHSFRRLPGLPLGLKFVVILSFLMWWQVLWRALQG